MESEDYVPSSGVANTAKLSRGDLQMLKHNIPAFNKPDIKQRKKEAELLAE